jgi:hypothetical protein
MPGKQSRGRGRPGHLNELEDAGGSSPQGVAGDIGDAGKQSRGVTSEVGDAEKKSRGRQCRATLW